MEVAPGRPRGAQNAPGTGIADDKAVALCLVIKYYLGEDPILKTCRRLSAGMKSSVST